MKIKKTLIARYTFALATLLLGATLEYFKIGKEFFEFSSVGTWLIYVGFVMIAVVTLQASREKKKIVDERMISIGNKASRITFVVILLTAFTTMIIDGIKTIKLPYSLAASYLICYMILIYFISYKILERYN